MNLNISLGKSSNGKSTGATTKKLSSIVRGVTRRTKTDDAGAEPVQSSPNLPVRWVPTRSQVVRAGVLVVAAIVVAAVVRRLLKDFFFEKY